MGLGPLVRTIYGERSLGIRVERAAQADPQNVWRTIFAVAGGVVLVTSLVGVRTIAQAAGASQMQFRHSIGNTALDAGGLIITADPPNTIYAITGNPLDDIQVGLAGIPVFGGIAGGLPLTGGAAWGLLLFTGNIQVTMTAAAGTGSTRFSLAYIPIDAGATVAVVA